MREGPDAELVLSDETRVGLEIVQVVDETLLHSKRRVDAAHEAIQACLEDERAVALTVYFDVDVLGKKNGAAVRKDWSAQISQQIRRLVASADDRGSATKDELRADGIEGIGGLEWAPSSRTTVTMGWWSHRPVGSTLVEAVLAKKDERLEHYRRTNVRCFDQYWLAVGYLAPGVVDDGFSLLRQRTYESRFDRVFLLECDGPESFRARDVTPK